VRTSTTGSQRFEVPWSGGYGNLVHVLWIPIVLLLVVSPGVGGTLLAGFLFVAWLALWQNRTIVDVDDTGVAVRFEPVPIPRGLAWSGHLAPEALQSIHIEERAGERIAVLEARPLYTLRAGATPVVRWTPDRNALQAIADAIETLVPHTTPNPTEGPRPTPIEGVYLDRTEQGLSLTLPWSGSHGAGVHLLWVLILPALLSGTAGTLLGLVLLAGWACMTLNTTTITVRSGTVQVENGPIPLPDALAPSGQFTRGALTHLEVREHERRGNPGGMGSYAFGPSYHYSLEASARPMLTYWGDVRKMDFVKETLERELRLENP
jgi:hypothetical protein